MLPTLAASSVASAMARLPCHPIDTIKSRLQVQGRGGQLAGGSVEYTGMVSCMRGVLRQEGISGLYRGIGITLPGSVPAGCLYFTSFELANAQLKLWAPNYPITSALSAGFFAEAFSCVLWVPIDVVKERLQVQSALPANSQLYRSSQHAFVSICRKEGLSGIYRGYGATLYSYGPFSALYFGCYETSKAAVSKFRQEDVQQLPMPLVVMCSAGAGSIAAWLSSPLDMIKLRIQVQRQAQSAAAEGAEGFSFGYRGVVDGLATVFREEGARALWRGAGTRMCFTVPNMSISMVAFEWCKRQFGDLG